MLYKYTTVGLQTGGLVGIEYQSCEEQDHLEECVDSNRCTYHL